MTEYEALRAWITDRLKGSTFEQDDYDAILRIIKNSGILAQDSPWHRPVPLPTWWE